MVNKELIIKNIRKIGEKEILSSTDTFFDSSSLLLLIVFDIIINVSSSVR